MAFETGTATDHVDLYNKLYTFLTSHTDLVTASQEWSEVWGHADLVHPVVEGGGPSQFMLKGPGLAGLDEVFVSFNLLEDDTNDIYGIQIRGHDAVKATGLDYADHVNTSGYVFVPLSSTTMTYWFVANGRRLVVVVKVSTVFEAGYAGLFQPFSTPAGYPYPMCVGGSAIEILRWSDENYYHTHFANPGPRFSPGITGWSNRAEGATLRVRLPGGSWEAFRNNDTGQGSVFPWRAEAQDDNFLLQSRPLLGGGYALTPASLVIDATAARGALGALEGVYHVPGFGNAAENTLTIVGVDHLVVQNAFRSGFEDYWALALE